MNEHSTRREYLLALRKQYRLNQSDIAAQLGMSNTTYSMMENGLVGRDIRLSMMEKIGQVFGMPVEHILHLEQEYAGKLSA